jgi:5-methylcytosine-specific restriction endonuclease McrA
MQKICTKCLQTQDLSEFYKDKKAPDGLSWHCKTCLKAVTKAWNQANVERARQSGLTYRQANRQKINQRAKDNYVKHQEKMRAKSHAYRANNPEKNKAIKAKSKAKNREKIRIYRKTHLARSLELRRAQWAKNPELYRQKLRQWRQNNPEKAHAQVSRRRAHKLTAPINDFTPAQWQEMKAAYNYQCVYCDVKTARLTMDHIIPLSRGGSHTTSNIVPACQKCNSRKGVREAIKPVQPLLLTVA